MKEEEAVAFEEEEDLDDDDSDSVEFLAEPKFKYKRMINDLGKIFERDAASAISVHDKFLAIGTHWGKVYILDHLGNITNSVNPAHTTAVNQISIDLPGDYLASCSNDGKIIIFGLCSSEHAQIISMDRPIRSVAIDPLYGRAGSGQQFVTGDRVLVLHEKGFLFAKNKQQAIFAGKEKDGFIHHITWNGSFICFANDTGIRVYDKDQKSMVTHVLRKHDLSLRAELYPAHICWTGESTFAIGWANTVTVCNIKGSSAQAGSSSGGEKFAEITYMLELPSYFVSGISFTSPDKFLVLFCVCQPTNLAEAEIIVSQQDENYTRGSTSSRNDEVGVERPHCPRVVLIEPIGLHTYDTLTEDIIEMYDCSKLLCHNYHMKGIGEENLYFLVANRDLVTVRPCNADDHVDWLLENRKFKMALEFTVEHEATALPSERHKRKDPLERYNQQEVGRIYLTHLIEEGKFEAAAELCVQVAGRKKDLWEEFVTKFEQLGMVKALSPVLPTKDPQLEPECYEMILLDFLRNDVKGFKKKINEWSPDLYRVGAIINETLNKLYQCTRVVDIADPNTRDLLETLAQLYTFERNYERALGLYLKLEHRNVFQLVERYRLFPLVQNQIHDLMRIDTNLAVRLLLDNEDSLPAATVVKQLTKQPKLQLHYLDRLFAKNEGFEFSDLAVSLYAEHNPKRLLAFLRNNSEHYKLEKALEICRQRRLLDAEVFLLARSGNRREALRVILKESRDIHQAIDFCKEHDDIDLWKDLISDAVTRPEFVTILMLNIGTHVDPTLLIRQIPVQMQIPEMKNSLIKTLQDYNMQISLQEGCQRVLKTDCYNLQTKLLYTLRRGRPIRNEKRCSLCCSTLTTCGMRCVNDILMFNCDHVYHLNCFEEQFSAPEGVKPRKNDMKLCPVCVALESKS